MQVLLGDYADMISDLAELQRRLQGLRELRGAQAVQRWQRMSAEGEFAALTRELLEQHYDPSYEASMRRNYQGFAEGRTWEVESAGAFEAMAARLREAHDPR